MSGRGFDAALALLALALSMWGIVITARLRQIEHYQWLLAEAMKEAGMIAVRRPYSAGCENDKERNR